MYLKFWGTRGSIPVPGNKTIKFGGNTPCVELRTDANQIFIFDAGSGIRELGKQLVQEDFKKDIKIFLSHYHWDHIQGIPFFLPLYKENNKIIFFGESDNEKSIENLLSDQMNDNYFPVKINQVKSKIRFEKITTDNVFNYDGLEIKTMRANHSSPTLVYKILCGNTSIVYMPDNELFIENYNPQPSFSEIKKLNENFIKFCSGCDYLIHDTFYDESTLKQKKGWGHSSNIYLAYFSILAEVKNLVLFHYNPDYDDRKIEEMLLGTKAAIQKENSKINCIAATEGLNLVI
ncbi:MAG: MBL fold metallo-hydrolase [Ignavibacteriaceae bacterium]